MSRRIDLDALRIDGATQSVVAHRNETPVQIRSQKPFLKGPIPLDWLRELAKMPAKTIVVGVAVWYLAGVTKSRAVKVTRTELSKWCVDRSSGYRALSRLENAKLVSIERARGRCPTVTVLELGGNV